jgi:hypothetical protein
MSRKLLVCCLHALCLASIAVPPSIIVRGQAFAVSATGSGAAATQIGDFGAVPDAAALESAFRDEAAAQGLSVLGTPPLETIRPGVYSLTLAAEASLSQRSTPIFYWQRTIFLADGASGAEVFAYNDTRASYAQPHVTLEIADHFLPAVDTVVGASSGLGGTEIRRTAEFDSADFESLAAAQLQERGARSLAARQEAVRDAMNPTNYTEVMTVVRSDGSRQTYAAGTVDVASLFGLRGRALTIDCVSNCFSEFGGGIGVITAACLVAGLVVCVAVCAGSAGVACIPCIGGAGTLCGVTIAAGSLAFCIARCINPNYSTPTPVPPPTPTPIPPCPGDCDGDGTVTVDELIRAVNIALGSQPLSDCPAADLDGDGSVQVNEIIVAVHSTLMGCFIVHPLDSRQ